VSVGRVTDIRVDGTGNTIEIDFEVFQERLATIGANVKRIQQLPDLAVFPQLRSRVVGNPVTGDAYLLLYVPANPPPPVALGFTPSRPYVASMPSPLATVQDRLPAVLERAEMTLQTLGEIVAKIPDSLDRSDRVLHQCRTHHPGEPASSIECRLTNVLCDHGGGDHADRDALDRTSLAADDLRRSLPAIRDALDQVRELARRLEEQPESVVYGPRQPGSKSR
jgi:paraquat-inducible protein B